MSEKAGLKLNSQKIKITESHHFMANRWGNKGNSDRLYFLGLQKPLRMVTTAMNLKDTCSLEETLWQTRQYNKKQRHYFIDKGLNSKSYGFASSQVLCEIWVIKKAECQRTDAFKTVVLEKNLEDWMESNPKK